MGTTAQIDKRTAAVDSAEGSVGHALVDKVLLVLAVVEHFHELGLGHFQTLKGLLLLDDGAGQGLESLLVVLVDRLPGMRQYNSNLVQGCNILSHVGHVIVEAGGVLGGRSIAEVAAEAALASFSQNMGRRVPEDLLAYKL